MKSKNLITFLGIGVIVLIIFAGSIGLPLPEGIPKNTVVVSRIKNCTVDEKSGKHETLSFVGIRLDDIRTPYLRWNPKLEMSNIKKYCKQNAIVAVEYTAKRTLLRPTLSYWIQNVKVQPDS